VLEVLVQELESQEELRVDVHDVVERHDVRMVQLLEEGDLPDRRRGHALLLVREADLFKREDRVSTHVFYLVHDAVRALADLLDLLVLLHGPRRWGRATGKGPRGGKGKAGGPIWRERVCRIADATAILIQRERA